MMRNLWWLPAASLFIASCSQDEPVVATTETGGAAGQAGAPGTPGSAGAAGAVAGGGRGGSSGSGAAGQAGQEGQAGAASACVLPTGAWSGDGRFLPFQAECAVGPDVGDCQACILGSRFQSDNEHYDLDVENDGTTIGYFDTGDYLQYTGVDLTGLNAIGVRYASEPGGSVEVRIDSQTGTLIGTWDVAATGGWTTWREARIRIEPVEGVHDIYIIGKSGSGISNFDYFVAGVCTPNCEGKTCGDDGCGGLCGECQGTDFCDATSNCQPCVPDCEGKECGDDTCGGSCGTSCGAGEVCSADRTCVAYDTLGGPPRLHVDGPLIKDPAGNTVVVRGVSLIDIGQQHGYRGGLPEGIDFITREGWNTEIVRMPVYPVGKPYPFPLRNSIDREQYMRDILRPAVDYATQKGLYVIIDWHEIASVTEGKDEDALAFWGYMAGQFADYPNVIYEVFNEPMDAVWACVTGANDDCWPPFKAKAQGWVDVIRSVAPESLVLVGGPSWSQVIGPAADDPIDDTNVAYVGHIYPMHIEGGFVEAQIRRCAAVHPVFLTEWGYGFDAADRTADKEPYYTDHLLPLVNDLDLHFTAWVADHQWGPPMWSDADGTPNDFGQEVMTLLAAE